MSAITIAQALDVAIAQHQAGRLADAEAMCRRILAQQPDHAEALYRLGVIACETSRDAEAAELFAKAIALSPAKARYHANVGVALRRLGRLDESAAAHERALALRPAQAPVHFNLANALHDLGRFGEAIANHRRAIALDPNLADAHWNLALLLLLTGQHEEGWREHEWRWRCAGYRHHCRNFSAPQWDGIPRDGKTILIHTEAGYGDTIQFLRYVPLVRERVGRVVLECQPALARLLEQSGGWNAEIVLRESLQGPSPVAFDEHVPLLSLPLALGLFEPLPVTQPYLQPDAALRAPWRERLGTGSNLRVGLAWAGNPAHEQDRARSISLDQLAPLLRVDGVSLYSLQIPGFRDSGIPGFIDLMPHVSDFADTAALMSELDLVITVDTAAAHLAGAVGRPVWTLLPFIAEWRWGIGREDSPWYPTMRLFRQPARGDWASVIERVTAEMEHLRAARSR